MKAYFEWVGDTQVLEGVFNANFDTTRAMIEIQDKMQQRKVKKVSLLLDVTDYSMDRMATDIITTFISLMSSQHILGWSVIYGTEIPIIGIAGATTTTSLRLRIRTAPTREDAIQVLNDKGVKI